MGDEQLEGGPRGNPLDGASEGRLRWAVNSSEWKPEGDFNGNEFQYLLSLISEPAEREAVYKFVRFVDQKRAVLSRLLVRRACAAVLGFRNFKEIEIARTKGKKPFLRKPRPPKDRPDLCNFNFNVSHEGEWVILASEPLCLCGVDVAAPHDRRPGGKEFDVFETFKEQLTDEEWRTVKREAASAVAKRMAKDKDKQMKQHIGAIDSSKLLPTYLTDNQEAMGLLDGFSFEERGDPSNRSTVRPLNQPVGYQAFQRFWSAKEAFVKARGDGLGFELNRAEFMFVCTDEAIPTYVATVAIDGKRTPQWRCFQERLGENHWATVARGPTDDVVDAYGEFSRTLTRPTSTIPFNIWEEELFKESPRFQVVPVGFLVPADDVPGYVAVGGIPWTGPTESDVTDVRVRTESEAHLVTEKEISRLEEKGKEHLQQKEFAQALQCYTSALDLTQEDIRGAPSKRYHLFCKQAVCHLEMQDFESALVDANKALEIDQGNSEAYFQRGRALEGLGIYAQALESLQQARQRKRDDSGAASR